MTELKDLLIKNIKNEVNNEKNVAIFFSAGTDSLTCLFSCLELKLSPHLYCFRLENHISEDSIMAEKISKLFKIPLKIIVIKEDINQVSKDVCDLIKKYNISNKIRIQILYPFPHMLKEVKEKIILTGLSADTLYGTNYHSKIHLLEDFSKSRKEAIIEDEIDGYSILKDLVENFEKKLIAPYRNEEVINYFLRHSWNELNEPIQKQHSVEAFKDYFNQSSIYRKSSSLTINAKIRDLHNNLLKSSLNQLNRESIEELYSDILHERIKE